MRCLPLCWFIILGCHALVLIMGRVRDLCQVKPTTSSLCGPTTVGIYYDPETQHCKYMGCSDKRLFASVADCDKICNNNRHIRRRMQLHGTRLNETTAIH